MCNVYGPYLTYQDLINNKISPQIQSQSKILMNYILWPTHGRMSASRDQRTRIITTNDIACINIVMTNHVQRVVKVRSTFRSTRCTFNRTLFIFRSSRFSLNESLLIKKIEQRYVCGISVKMTMTHSMISYRENRLYKWKTW